MHALAAAATAPVLVALLVALTVVLVALALRCCTPHRCYLDLLNAEIAQQTDFRPFYACSAGQADPPAPGLPDTREVIPELGELEDNWEVVRDEMLAATLSARQREAGLGPSQNDTIPRMDAIYNRIFSLDAEGPGAGAARAASRLIYGDDVDTFTRIGSADWRTYNLVLFDHDVPGNAERCPRTVEMLRRVPGMQSALFSIVGPGGYIPPHSDPAKGVIRYHLGLRVPRERRRCHITVAEDRGDGGRYCWDEGCGVLFDDAFEHWVHNDTPDERVILFVDILRPLHGRARMLQGLANFANRYHPGVRSLIRRSRVPTA